MTTKQRRPAIPRCDIVGTLRFIAADNLPGVDPWLAATLTERASVIANANIAAADLPFCLVCAEVRCDPGCPLEPFRQRTQS